MSSIFLLIACIIFISSINAVELPGNYTLPKDSPNFRFIARFDLVLNVEYTQLDGKKNISEIPLNNETFQYYDGPSTLKDTHTLVLTMLDNLTTISLEFSLDGKNKTSLQRVLATITISDNKYFPNCSKHARGIHTFVANESLFITDRSKSYRCNTQTKIDNFKSDGNVTIKSIDLQNVRIQSFVDDSIAFHDYAPEDVCLLDRFRDDYKVPIIVGVCLAVLVIVVLVVYLVLRRRSHNGYQSV